MLPQILQPLKHMLEGFLIQEITIGQSQAGVWLATRDSSNWFIKAQKNTVELEIEAGKIRWLASRGLQVPKLIDYLNLNDTAFLVTEALSGKDASQTSNPKATTIALAHSLRHLHNFEIENCPFDRTLNTTLQLAKQNLTNGLVDETDFDPARLGTPAFVIYQQLLEKRPKFEDLVLTHGDFCLPNIILTQNKVTGLIDLGRAGVADRYQDIALILRNITSELNPDFNDCSDIFAQEYEIDLEPDKLEYYQILDEFF